MILEIFLPQKLAKQLSFLAQITAIFLQKPTHNISF
jgi:hypothetical protein